MFGKLGALAGKIGGAVSGAMDHLINAEELDAVIAATVLVAAADGKIDDVEKEAAFKGVSTHESLKSFDQKVIRAKFDSDATLINADRELAEEVLYDKVSVIKDKIARIRVLGIVQQIANADGEFSAAEKKVVDKIRKITGQG